MIKFFTPLFLLFTSYSFSTSCEIIANRHIVFNKTLSTVGDSITWQGDGQYLRCLMRDNGLSYEFAGTHTDQFYFQHEGEGGNTTLQVLDRINQIPVADAYFLLIGINDVLQNVPEHVIVSNIITISNKLYEKNNNAKIYISTLLPIIYQQNIQVQNVNRLLLSNIKICKSCSIINIGGQFYNLQNWQSYLIEGIHPNIEGYKRLSKFIAIAID